MLQSRRSAVLLTCIVTLISSIALWAQAPHTTPLVNDTLRFEETGNALASGQAMYTSRVGGLRFDFLGERASVVVSKTDAAGESLSLSLAGSSAEPKIAPGNQLPGIVNYLPSGDPKTWRTNLHTYGAVKYQGVYPGIDLVYYGNRGQLEYDFIVAPHQDPAQIALKVENAEQVAIRADGGLSMGRGEMGLHFAEPVIYQVAKDGRREPVSGHYVRRDDGNIGFEIGPWDRNRELIIDPVLVWSQFVGTTTSDAFFAMTIDSSSNMYLAGRNGGPLEVEKISADGKTVVYHTTLGSSYNSYAYDIAVDASGNAYVGGYAGAGFPTTAGAYQQTAPGGSHAYVAVLNAAGTALTYGSFLAGTTTATDVAQGVAVDSTGKVYITGYTNSTTFPTTLGVYQTKNTNGGQTAFVAKFDPTKSGTASLVYSTYLSGPTGASVEYGIAVDTAGNAYVAGQAGADFPVTAGAFAYNGEGVGAGGVYITKLNPAATALTYSAYLGPGQANGITVDGSGGVYLTGSVPAGYSDFPTTTGAFQVAYPDGFAAELNAAGSGLVYSTFLSGAQELTYPTDIAIPAGCASACNAFITGYTTENDLTLVNPIQAFNGSYINGTSGNDVFVTQLNGTGTAAVYSTYIGGSSDDSTASIGHSPAIAANSTGDAFVAGYTGSQDFPVSLTTTPYRSYFALRIGSTAAATAVAYPLTLTFSTSQTVGVGSTPQTVTLRNMGSSAMTITSIVPSPSDYAQTNNCGSSLSGGAECTITVTFTPTAAGSRPGTLVITQGGNNSPNTVTLTGSGANNAYGILSVPSLSFPDQAVNTASAAQSVTLTNVGNTAMTLNSSAFSISTNFAQVNNCPASLATNASCTINIAFLPTSASTFNGSLFISSNSVSPNNTVVLTGVGFAGTPTLTPSTTGLVFGPQVIGTTSSAQTAYLTNTGNVPVVISGSSVTGDFTVAGCVQTVNPGGYCGARINFVPTATGARTGTVTFTDSTSAGTHSFALSGTGLAPTETLVINPTSVTFADTAVGASSANFTIQVTNTSDTTVNVTRVFPTGDYRLYSTSCVQNLRSAGVCNITVQFVPTATGTRAGTIVLEDNATGSPQSVTLSGKGLASAAAAIVTPDNVVFGTQAVGTTNPNTYTVTLQNVGNVPFDASNVAFTGTNASDFQISYPGCNAQIVSPGRNCQVQFTFTPTAAGARSATLTFTNIAGTQTVPISGTGVAATFSLVTVPSTLTFQAQQKSTTSPTQYVWLINTGTAPINVTTVVSGTTDYSASGCASTTIQPNTSCYVAVNFTPTVTTTDNSSFTITSNATGSPQTVTLNGSGASAAAAMQLFPSGLQFNSQVVSTTSPAQSVSVQNNSGSTVTGIGFSVTGANAADFTLLNNNCTSSLANGSQCSFQVTFKPGATGARSAAVSIADSAGTQTVSLSGFGIVSTTSALLVQKALAFLTETVGFPAQQQSLTFYNTGSAPITISSVTLGGTNAGDFAITSQGCPISPNTFNAGSACNIYVNFTPTAAGARTATVTITDNAPGSPRTVTLTGKGVASTLALEVSPTTMTFPPQVIATTSNLNAQAVITNVGTGPVTISSIALGGTNPGDFSLSNGCPASLPQGPLGNTCPVNVYFTPTASGARKATVTVTDNAGTPVVVNVSGTGLAQTQTVAVTPTTMQFDPQVTGTTSAAQYITVTNTGNYQVTFTNVTITTGYALSNGCTGTLPPGTSCQIGVTFTPTATGAKTGTVTITDSAKPGPQKVTLSGTGIANTAEIQLSQTTVTFDAQTLNTTSQPQLVYYYNQGNTAITISTIAQTGTVFSLSSSSCVNGTQVSPGSYCYVRTTFTPTAAGAATSTVTITDNAPGSPRKITLNGTGITGALPEANLTPAKLTFASQAVGTTSPAQNLNLTNNGNANMTISSIAITGTNAGDYAQSNNCVSPLVPGFSCNIAVTFSPTATGTRTATVSVTDSASGSPHTAALTGTATVGSLPVVTLNPASLSFPNVPLNTLSSQAVTVTNTGTAALTFTGISITGTVPSNWAQTNTCTGSIAVNGTCTITVKFTPSTLENQTASVTLTDNAGNSPQTLPITGNGAFAALFLSPTSISFGTVKVGSTSAPQTITVENYGNATLNLTSVTVTGAFLISANTCGTTLTAGATCTVSVEFKPTTTGATVGNVVFTDNAGDSPQYVALGGTGN